MAVSWSSFGYPHEGGNSSVWGSRVSSPEEKVKPALLCVPFFFWVNVCRSFCLHQAYLRSKFGR